MFPVPAPAMRALLRPRAAIAADKVTFTNTVQRDQAYELTYTGTLDAAGTSMKGEIAVMGVTGTFSGTKDAANAASAPTSGALSAGKGRLGFVADCG